MASLNLVALIGNVGRIETRQTQTGIPVTSFSLALNKTYTNSEGVKVERTLWVRVTCWRKLAENIAAILHKGDLVQITGELREPGTYTDRAGNPQASIEVEAHEVNKLTPKGNGEPTAPAPTPTPEPPKQQDPLTIPAGDDPF